MFTLSFLHCDSIGPHFGVVRFSMVRLVNFASIYLNRCAHGPWISTMLSTRDIHYRIEELNG